MKLDGKDDSIRSDNQYRSKRSTVVEKELQKQVNQHLLIVNINRLSKLTSMSIRYLEKEVIISDSRNDTNTRKFSKTI